VRVISLLPAATEIVYALGVDADLVGVTFECDEPAVARAEKAVVVGGLDTRGLAPGAIDALVRDRLAAGADLYTVDTAAVAALRPDLILTQDLCRVCAVPAGQVDAALAKLGCAADVLRLDPHTLDEVLDTVLAVGRRTGAGAAAERLVAGLREELARVAGRVAGLPRPRVAVVEWVDPPFSAGHWVPDLVTAAGGTPVGGRPGGRSQPTTWAGIAATGPDVVLVAPCGYRLPGAAEQARVAAAALAGALPGVPVWAIDADGLVVRPGPRLVTGVAAIAAVLHPAAAGPPPPGTVHRVAG
jgi:iron complex transport system substrate-binding protein